IVGPESKDFPHEPDSALALLIRQQDKTEMVLCLNVVRVDGQLTFKRPRRFIKLPQIQIDQAGVEMRQTGLVIQRQSRIQLFERLGRLALVIVNLSEQNMKLRAAAVQGP